MMKFDCDASGLLVPRRFRRGHVQRGCRIVGPAFFGGGAAGGPLIPPPLDSYTTRLLRARSIYQRLLTSYTGALFRIRNLTTGVETDIGYDPSTNLVNLAAVAAACGINDGGLVNVYDHSGNGYQYQPPQIMQWATSTHSAASARIAAIDLNVMARDATR